MLGSSTKDGEAPEGNIFESIAAPAIFTESIFLAFCADSWSYMVNDNLIDFDQ